MDRHPAFADRPWRSGQYQGRSDRGVASGRDGGTDQRSIRTDLVADDLLWGPVPDTPDPAQGSVRPGNEGLMTKLEKVDPAGTPTRPTKEAASSRGGYLVVIIVTLFLVLLPLARPLIGQPYNYVLQIGMVD